jgi:hypothetical protein
MEREKVRRREEMKCEEIRRTEDREVRQRKGKSNVSCKITR